MANSTPAIRLHKSDDVTPEKVSTPPKSRRKKKSDKPAKPYHDFPLFPHATKRWAKKIRGKLHYFGPWSDPDAALTKYLEQKDDLFAGRKPVDKSAVFTVENLVNKFLASKRARVDRGKMTARSFAEYHSACQRALDFFGWNRAVNDLRGEDFTKFERELPRKWGPHRLNGEIQRVRSLFKFAFDEELIDRTIRFGTVFKKATKREMRIHRAASVKKFFDRGEILALVNGAAVVGENGPELVRPGLQLRAMLLLATNCGFGNNDCGMLPLSALDLDAGWINFLRPKTGIDRRCPLWAETVAALRDVLKQRPAPKEEAAEGKVFVTKYGKSWSKHGELTFADDGTPTANHDNPVSKEMRKLLDLLGLNGHRNFYCLRHTFETIGGASRDQVAVDAIMGHVDPSMGATYREHIDDDRLRAVANHVRGWLFGKGVQP